MPKNDGLHKPNKDMDQCQCVWNHADPTFYRTIDQCIMERSEKHNLYCAHCADQHGNQAAANGKATELV
jgi:hypothetical protein